MNTFDTARLLPRPRHIALKGGACSLKRFGAYHITGNRSASGELEPAVRELASLVGHILSSETLPDRPAVTLDVSAEGVPGKGAESYVLTITADRILIRGTPRALFWALKTLRQILTIAGSTTVPCCVIRDWPALSMRGFADDISRRQISTVQDFESIIRHMAAFKLNVYQPYFEDVVFVDKQPMLGYGRGRLTRDEIGAMIDCGRRHHVEILPQFNSCSHQEHMLSRPEYSRLRYRGNLENLDPSNPETIRFLTDVYEQILAQFPCRYFHLGMDEARGLRHRPDLYVAHANRLARIVLRAGKIPLMYHDMFVPYDRNFTKYSPRLLDRLDRRIVLNQWMYGHEPEFLDEITRRGFSAVISPTLQCGFCGSSADDWKRSRDFIKYALGHEGVIGILQTHWNDSGGGDRYLNRRGLAMTADLAWSGPGSDSRITKLTGAFDLHFYGIGNGGLSKELDTIIAAGNRFPFPNAQHLLPRTLAQTSGRDLRAAGAAKKILRETRNHERMLLRVRRRATRNIDHLDHIRIGLRRISAAAQRTKNAPSLLRALLKNDLPAVERACAEDRRIVEALREEFSRAWLRRNKPEGLEYYDHHFRAILSQDNHLAADIRMQIARAKRLLESGYRTIDCSGKTVVFPPELSALPWGAGVFDNIPWHIINPDSNGGTSIMVTRSENYPEAPHEISIEVNAPATRIHFLHGLHGRESLYGKEPSSPARYRLAFDSGKPLEIRLRNSRDVANWWMPFGHMYGGGGIHALDTSTCRLAWMEQGDLFQGHCLYHFHHAISGRRRTVRRLEIIGGNPHVSLVCAAVTLFEGDPGAFPC